MEATRPGAPGKNRSFKQAFFLLKGNGICPRVLGAAARQDYDLEWQGLEQESYI
ncbi:hypothetical protein KIS4809_1004 [Bacillus sp. ZZV12-4809]|nr:hypothetical protein KIS4809_1004 [Bacillus sp. ZZV12-4809]